MATKPSLKAHWITLLARIADAGRDGICVASSDRRTAEALRSRELVDSRLKSRYVGLDEPLAGPFVFYFLTDAGRDWLVAHRENPTASRAVPAGWTMVAAGHYLHTASRVEIVRKGARWGVLRPLGPVTEADPMFSVVDEAGTRTAAFAAADKVIPAQIEFVQAATFESTGRPETWPAGQADETTVDARHLAVRASGARTGWDAQPGDRVVHLELGTRGLYVTGDNDCSYVLFDGATRDELVHSSDVVVIDDRHPAAPIRTGYEANPGDTVRHHETGAIGTFHGLVHYDKPFHGLTGDWAGVTWNGSVPFPQPARPEDLIVVAERRAERRMQVAREPKHADDTDLGGPDEPGGDYYLLVDGQRIGGTYWCGADYIPDGQRWASWGVAGLSLHNPSRQAAEKVQVDAYVADPDVQDQRLAEERIEEFERHVKREAELAAREEQYRIERLGADAKGDTIWQLPPYHNIIAGSQDDVRAVKAWLDAHDLRIVSAAHPIRVEQRAERNVIVYERMRWQGETETWVVTCKLDPPDVDRTARPDLVALIEAGHRPAKFPLIDFGQDLACSACTKELGSATEMVLWECPSFATARADGDAARAAADAALAEAEQAVIRAEAAQRVAACLGRDTTPEDNLLRTAEIDYVRRRLAVDVVRRDPARHADIRFLMVSDSDDDGSTWRPVHWLGVGAEGSETASAMALRYAATRYLIDNPAWVGVADPWELRSNPRPFRVEVFTDPTGEQPDGVWTNLTGPCRPGRHNPGGHPITNGAPRQDGCAVERACCAICFHRVWRIAPGGRWVLEGDQLLGPSGHPYPDSDPDPDPDSASKINTAMSSGPNATDVSFGYRIETRTGRRWTTVRVGNTPPIYRPDPTVLWAAADTILGNARQVLGLATKDPLPGVRVRAWDRQTGLVRMASRRATRKVNQRA